MKGKPEAEQLVEEHFLDSILEKERNVIYAKW